MKSSYTIYRDEFNKFTVITPKTYRNGGHNAPFILKDQETGESFELIVQECIDLGDNIKYVLSLHGFIELGREYYAVDRFGSLSYLMLGYICRTKEFNRLYVYEGNDLGLTYPKDIYGNTMTQFKVWTPTASQVRLITYDLGINGEKRFHSMKRNDDGVWEYTFNDYLEGFKYKFEVINNLVSRECIDPYAKFSTENGEYSVAYDIANIEKADRYLSPKLEKPTDAIIYEVNIRDFTIDSSSNVKNPGTYRGFVEKLDYLKELGVTHLQIMPFFDFEGVDEVSPRESYNWGYNPSQFNVPEGSFSSNPTDPKARIEELIFMINEIHKAGLGVVMDCVYNHVYERKTHPFDALVPTYFFRHDHVGMPTNGSGCGNDIASERRMVRKYILDSINYWLNQFAIDGFRFDLMGLLDISTMNKIRMLCDKYDKGILLYGEGWDMQTALSLQDKANSNNMCKMPRISYFNDTYRDFIKGNSFNIYDRGLSLGRNFHSNKHQQLLAGSSGLSSGETFLFFSPSQTINYVDCHDGYTLWDKIRTALSHKTEEECKQRHILTLSMLIFSQGIPFLHCGSEFFRSKNGEENSYKSPDEVNSIKWGEVNLNSKYIDEIKKYIELRKLHGAFRFDTSVKVKKHLTILRHYDSVIEYRLNNVSEFGPFNDIHIFFNTQNYNFELPVTLDGMYIYNSKMDSLNKMVKENIKKVTLNGIGTTILVR